MILSRPSRLVSRSPSWQVFFRLSPSNSYLLVLIERGFIVAPASGERVSLWVLCAVFRRLRINNPNICCSAQLKTLDDFRHRESAALRRQVVEFVDVQGFDD